MVLYFSGTGNSHFAAEKLAEALNDEIISLNSRIKNNDLSEISSETPFVICVPTYSWQIPHIVENYLKKTKLSGTEKAYFIMTCGDDNGNAASYISAFCNEKKLEFMGCISIVMPENYIAMFSSPSDSEAQKIIGQSLTKIQAAAEIIRRNETFPNKTVSAADKLKSGIVNKMFYTLCVKASKFYATNKCVSCGKCVEVCPLNNVKLKNGRPTWSKECTHCMACISRCPVQAIEYSAKSQGQNRYICKFENIIY